MGFDMDEAVRRSEGGWRGFTVLMIASTVATIVILVLLALALL